MDAAAGFRKLKDRIMLKRRPTLRSPADLARAGLVPAERVQELAPVAAHYAMAITPALYDLIEANDPHDPIARQFVPSADELARSPDEIADPIGDARHSPVPGIVHRHADRVLLKLTHLCPVYCRFCFRRETVGPENGRSPSKPQIEAALGYIAEHKEIWEVILTGGDPFVLTPRKLAEVSARLGAIGHVKIVRWHTRMPIADPDAITPALIAALKRTGKTTFAVIHANHPRELSASARAACARLTGAGISLLSQSVLLKGVNDNIETLESLMRALAEAGVKPYYLHHADLAPGTAHFRTTVEKGRGLMRALHARASGLCLPRYVLDIPGGHSKAGLEAADAECEGEGDSDSPSGYYVRDSGGGRHFYRG